MRDGASPHSRPCLRTALALIVAFTGLIASAATRANAGTDPITSYDVSKLRGAAEYSTRTPKAKGFVGSEAPVLYRVLAQVNTARGISLQTDNRLAQLSRWVYERLMPESSLPPQSALDLVTHHLGLPEPVPHMLMLQAEDAPRLARVVAQRLEGMFDLSNYTHIGGVAEREPDRVTVVIALSIRHLVLAPVARKLAAGGRLALGGELLDGYAKPELAHTLPDGTTRVTSLGRGAAFSATLDMAATGRHRVEIMASGPRGPEVVANFPIYVGVPAEERVEAAAGVGRAMAPSAAQTRLLELINQERAKAGVAPVKLDPELSQVAKSHSEDMLKNRFVGHTSPTTGSMEERIMAAGIVTDLAAENIGRGYTPEEIHRGLMESPGHRSAIQHPDVTHVGIGIAAKRETGRTAYLVTELFIRRIGRLDPNGSRAVFLAELNRVRESGGQPAVAEDPALSRMADEAAREYVENAMLTHKAAADRLERRLMESDLELKSAGVVFSVVGSLKEGASVNSRLGARIRRVGIGIAQGSRPGLVPNAIVLVVVFTE